LVDPKLKKSFIECRDHWQSLNDRANSAAAKRRQYQKEIKESGFSMQQIKISLLLQTPEGEAEFKAEMANRLLAAAYSDADIGDQLSLFLDHDRTPAVDRAYKEGQSSAMKNEAAVPKYDPDTDQYRAFMEGYHAEQERQVKAGIGKLDTGKGGKGKGAKASAKGAKPAGKRGRPAGSGKKGANAEPPTGSERTLIPKAEKDAKAAARNAKPSAPPRKPAAVPVTRASLAASKAAAKDDAESYFTKNEPKGSA
jgi:hypothetical protein